MNCRVNRRRCLYLLLAAAISAFALLNARAEESPAKEVAATTELVVQSENGDQRDLSMRYWLYLPELYSADEETTCPLLLFLHGGGERGDDLELVRKHGPPNLVEEAAHQKTWPFITVSPQCPKENRVNVAKLPKLVEHPANTNRVNRRRIYVTGLSMGGAFVLKRATNHRDPDYR